MPYNASPLMFSLRFLWLGVSSLARYWFRCPLSLSSYLLFFPFQLVEDPLRRFQSGDWCRPGRDRLIGTPSSLPSSHPLVTFLTVLHLLPALRNDPREGAASRNRDHMVVTWDFRSKPPTVHECTAPGAKGDRGEPATQGKERRQHRPTTETMHEAKRRG